jgi:PIN domain nuclease of toxin-antitoxin system
VSNSIVLDASAILAILYEEPGAAKVSELLNDEGILPLASAVNWCEAHTRLLRDGLEDDEAWKLLADLNLTVVPFEEADAYRAGQLYRRTSALGLSLGDRACLALALKEGAVAWTADRVWKRLKVDVEIELIRI